MRSASTVDAAIERTCAGDAHGPQAAVSAIGRGRWGRWQRVRARTAAALRNARDHSVWLMYPYHLELALSTYYLRAVEHFKCAAFHM